MALLPSGTVTFLLTDIEGLTQLWQEHTAQNVWARNKEQPMGRLYRSAIALVVVVAAMLATFVVVGAQPAVAQLPVVCHGAPYVYSNVTVYKAHTDSIECHTVYGHTDHLVDRVNQGLSPSLSGFACHTAPEGSRLHVECTNLEHPHHRFAVSWITHPSTTCAAAVSTPASSIPTRTRAV